MADSPAKPARRWVRPVVGLVLTLVWLAVAGIGGPLFGRIGEVATNDRATFLPASAESTEVSERLAEFQPQQIPAIVVVEADGMLGQDDLQRLNEVVQGLTDAVDGVAETSPAIPSEDGEAAQIIVALAEDAEVADAVEALRTHLTEELGEGLSVGITGPAGFTADLAAGFAGIDGFLLLVTLTAVLIILIIVYRSPLLPVIVLLTSVSALCLALLINFELAQAEVVTINGQVQGILFILVIGAATDYSLLYVARYRETLREHLRPWTATKKAIKSSLEPILASAGTVIVGLMCLLLSDLESNAALGPVASIGIACAVLGSFTFLPAMLLLAGRIAFWPRMPVVATARHAVTEKEAKGLWPAISRLVARRDRVLWIGMTLLLAVGAVGVVQLQANGVPQSEFVLGTSAARDGQAMLSRHFPSGSGSPTDMIVPEDELVAATDRALELDGVSSAAVVSDSSQTGSIPWELYRAVATGEAPPQALDGPFRGAEPTVSNGDVLVQLTLTDAADSTEAEDTVRDLRSSLDEIAPGILIGGTTAVDLDTNDTSIRDRNLIIPIVLVAITIILALLLRSLLAPVLLLITTAVSFGTAMGVSALLFNHVLDFPGADPSVPLYGFVFLVALGIDYNIFLMTRVREESLEHGTRDGVLRGLSITGGVITSAGIVLAATFAALAVIPVMFLVQLAIIVAFGVLLDALLVRSLLVPALVHDIGNKVWWPAKLARQAD